MSRLFVLGNNVCPLAKVEEVVLFLTLVCLQLLAVVVSLPVDNLCCDICKRLNLATIYDSNRATTSLTNILITIVYVVALGSLDVVCTHAVVGKHVG